MYFDLIFGDAVPHIELPALALVLLPIQSAKCQRFALHLLALPRPMQAEGSVPQFHKASKVELRRFPKFVHAHQTDLRQQQLAKVACADSVSSCAHLSVITFEFTEAPVKLMFPKAA